MSSFIIRTKLLPPEPAGGRLDRPRITRVLREAVRQRCTLIVADAGWGKTCALAQLRHLGLPLVWYSLDGSDNDPAILAAHLLEGFDGALPGLAGRVRDTGAGDPEAVVAQLANALLERGNPEVILAFDDMHHLAGRSGGARLLRELLDRLPSGVRVAASSRRLPPWPLARIKAAGGLNVIHWDVLAYTREEAAAYLERAAGRSADAAGLEALLARTGGWPVALRLLAQGWSELERHGKSGAEWLSEYVRQEILTNLSAGDRELLRGAALLDRFDGPLLDQALGRTDASRTLERLSRRGGLLVGSIWGDGYQRLHPLIGDPLREEAEDALGPAGLREFHRRAGEAWRRRGARREAVEHFLRADDGKAAAETIADMRMALLDVPALETMEQWLARLDKRQRRRPGVRLLAGLLHHRRGRYREALPELSAALSLYRARGDRSGLIACAFILVETLIFLDRTSAVLEVAGVMRSEADAAEWRMLRVTYPIGLALNDRFEEAEAEWRASAAGDAFGRDSDLELAMSGAYANYMLIPLGRLDEALALMERVVAGLRRRDVYGRLAMNLAFLAHVRFEQGCWREARDAMKEAIRVAVERGWPGFVPSMRLMLARIAAAAGDEDAGPLLARALASCPEEDAGMYRGYFRPVLAAVLAARNGDRPGRDREAARARRALEPLGSVWLRGEALLELAPAYLDMGDCGPAAELAVGVLEMTRALPVPFLRARAGLLLAVARAGLGDAAGARAALSEAMEAADSCGQTEALLRREDRLMKKLDEHRTVSPRANLHIQSLGHLEVRADGREVRWRRRRDRQVFAYLLTACPNAVPRDLLIDAFWPDAVWPAALSNLYNAVSQMRRALDAAGADGAGRIILQGEAYRLVLGPGDFWDVEEVRRLDHAVRGGDAEAARRLEHLTRSEYLADDRYTEWAGPVRQETAAARRRALRLLREAAQARGEREEALAWAETLVREDPTDESDLVHFMTLLVRSGRRNRALAQYRRYVRELDESLGLSPSRAVKTAIRSILAGDFRLPGQDA